jgi:Gnt-I system low-affinity gluconate transporter
MSTLELVLITVTSVALLLLLVLRFKIHAFISLILVSIMVGLFTGMDFEQVLTSIQEGMAGVLGYIAVVVGIGAIFGEILQDTGGVESLAKSMLDKFGEKKSSWALMTSGFLIAIPVFFEVGFIILVPMAFALARKTGKSVLFYAIPMMAGLAVTHAFIPPTPGPIAVAEIIDVPLGWIIIFGFIIGFPTAIVAGPWFGKYIAKKIYVKPPEIDPDLKDITTEKREDLPSARWSITLIGIPLFLILLRTLIELGYNEQWMAESTFWNALRFIGHPFIALLIATLLAGYVLGIRRGYKPDQIMRVANAALSPAGLIILVTGAGGVFKQVLVDSGVGESLAMTLTKYSISPVILAYIISVVVRVTQGSATVAMITAAGMIAPVVEVIGFTDMEKSLLVIAIASGSTMLSHVNDSGFWLVGKYLNMSEKQTLKSWSVMESLISAFSFIIVLILAWIFG